jgi:hypothetical protein
MIYIAEIALSHGKRNYLTTLQQGYHITIEYFIGFDAGLIIILH